MSKTKIVEKSKCNGCMACYNVCPMKCIDIKEDKDGFLIPVIDESKCIDCGLCGKVCSIQNTSCKNGIISAYAVINKDDEVRTNSSSGGFFSALANEILKQNGVVFGAVFDKDFSVVHTDVTEKSELSSLYGSKYVQSNVGNTFAKVEEYLKCDKTVLYCGTPCQIEGLKLYLKNKKFSEEKLITIDLSCHGVASPGVWKKYLDYRKEKDKSVPLNINFRDKSNGWNNFNMCFSYDDSNYKSSVSKDLFLLGFLRNVYLRESCYSCHFKGFERISDFTIGDFWGVEEVIPEMYDNKGTSIVLLHTEKAERLFDQIVKTKAIEAIQVEKIDEIKNEGLVYSAFKNPERKAFFKKYNSYSFEKLYDKCFSDKFVLKLRRHIARKRRGK
ncbi:MAG: Coenzyme F420 hydrogenase/dehydrogenase, beta subunit C-terminal domain [Ruminococcus sp.]|nr:Coenzyme F420 hydrogenase/dehydrogenase, beta subunit C-terminal domain [Ruminococcus sp.]